MEPGDPSGILPDRGVFAEDLFHPNESGHALWAQAAGPGLRQVLAALATT